MADELEGVRDAARWARRWRGRSPTASPAAGRRATAANLPAQAFWRTIIGRCAGGWFEERAWGDDKWRGPVQFFDGRDRA